MEKNTGVLTIQQAKPTHIRWYGGALVLFLCFVAYIDRIVFSVSASPIMDALQITPVEFGLVTTLFNIGYFVFQIPGAMMIEKMGSRFALLNAKQAEWSILP